MAYSTTNTVKLSPLGGGFYFGVWTATDIQTSGANTLATGLRKIVHVSYQNTTRAAAGGLKVTVSGGTITFTAETADDDFEVFVIGRQ